jgi:hypothetical protein
MKYRDDIELKFQTIFGISYAEGVYRLKILIMRSISMECFIHHEKDRSWHSKISMNEKDFKMLAFFAMLGAGYMEELGLKALPSHDEKYEKSLVIEAEFEEKRKD